uniref:Uncharacterized protein n=1 Tax=candidate division WOR-3 bacterium TaxID=2052148 RepID=A0A7C3Z3Q7_UNCW3
MEENLLESLKNASWEVALKTYGNDHSTLIGLIVSWWVLSKRNRFALEGGPSFGYRKRGEGRGNCDALLLEGDEAKGVVEVENWDNYQKVINKIGKFFTPEYEELKSLEFGILLVYPIGPSGRGNNRRVPEPPADLVDYAKGLTSNSNHPSKTLILLILEKKFERIMSGTRRRNPYYQCTPQKIEGYLIKDGKIIKQETLAQRMRNKNA